LQRYGTTVPNLIADFYKVIGLEGYKGGNKNFAAALEQVFKMCLDECSKFTENTQCREVPDSLKGPLYILYYFKFYFT
jgi:hypothetical protein